MRKIWRRIFLLCVACMICMQGLCLAGLPQGNWMHYYNDGSKKYYLNTDSVKVREYTGRKYLEVITLANTLANTELWVQYWMVFDIENSKCAILEWSFSDGRVTKGDISKITYSLTKDRQAMLQWVEQNRPDVINEIRTFNQSAPQPSPELPGAPNDRRSSGNLRSLTYTPRQSQTATLAYSAYDWGNLSEVYRNPYTDGCEYVVITSFERKEGGRSFSHYRDSFDYIPDDPDDPGAGGEFLFTGGHTRADDLNQYYMRARVEGDALRVEWLMGNRQNGPQRNTGVAYPEDTYRLQPITDAMYDIAFFEVANMSYRFVSTRGISSDKKSCLSDDYASAIAVMFAFLDFLNEGNTPDAIVEPPPGITLPNHGGLKQPELYREPGLTF